GARAVGRGGGEVWGGGMRGGWGLIGLYCPPKRTPAPPPMAPPMRKVREMMRLTLIPMREAAGWSSATARMALPIFVLFTSEYSPHSMSRAATITTSDFMDTSMVEESSKRRFRVSMVG